MITGTTSTGFSFEIDPEVVLDMDFLDLACEAEENGARLGKVYEYALGKVQYRALKDHVKAVHGRAKLEKFKEEMDEIFEAVNENAETKN